MLLKRKPLGHGHGDGVLSAAVWCVQGADAEIHVAGGTVIFHVAGWHCFAIPAFFADMDIDTYDTYLCIDTPGHPCHWGRAIFNRVHLLFDGPRPSPSAL